MTVNQPEVCVGGCLHVTGDGELRVNVGGTVWPYDCQESEGQPLYCGSDGILRTRPIPRHVVVQEVLNAPAQRLLNGGETPNHAATITNPSECLEAQVVAFAWVTHRYQLSAGNHGETHVWTHCETCDDPVENPLWRGRGAPGGGPARARAITTGGEVGRSAMIATGGTSAGRRSVITSDGPVRRVSAGAAPNDQDNLVQSDSAVGVQEGVVWTDGSASVREGSIWSGQPVDTAMVALDNGTRETGAVNGMARPRRFTVGPGNSFTFRMRVIGVEGDSGDTFSDVNMGILLMLTTQPGVPT